jgi:hypothetical protein
MDAQETQENPWISLDETEDLRASLERSLFQRLSQGDREALYTASSDLLRSITVDQESKWWNPALNLQSRSVIPRITKSGSVVAFLYHNCDRPVKILNSHLYCLGGVILQQREWFDLLGYTPEEQIIHRLKYG